MFKTWDYCFEHEMRSPSGRLCPKCEVGFERRQKVAKLIDWTEAIPFSMHVDYSTHEQAYCRDEEYALMDYEGSNVNKKEELRTILLEKRAEFLRLYVHSKEEEIQNVYKSENSD